MPPTRILIAALGLIGPLAQAADYPVGPGQTYSSISDVPWESLGAGDRVLIHHRPAPYAEKILIGVSGSPGDPIIVRGLPGPNGERPVIDGRNATTRQALDYWGEERGVIKVGGSSVPPDTTPSHIVIEGLEIRSAHPDHSFTDDAGMSDTYTDNAASIYVEKANDLTIRDCEIHDSGNGIFVGAFNGQTRDILISGNYIHGNGIDGSIFEHNTYTEAIGITYEFNRFGPLRPGAGGNNLKDRSAGLVVRYNWIDSGNRQLDLVDGGNAVTGDPDYDRTFVYGNVLIEREGEGNSQVLHYGGDSGNTANYRKGRLHFYHNTVVSTRTGNTTLMRLSTNDESAELRNNAVFVTAAGSHLALLDDAGVAELSGNWLKQGWQDSHGALSGSVSLGTGNIDGTDPGFVDFNAEDYHPANGSPLLDGAVGLHAEAAGHPVDRQYRRHLQSIPRDTSAPMDIGALAPVFESVFRDRFEALP